jgi:hypothetical protein
LSNSADPTTPEPSSKQSSAQEALSTSLADVRRLFRSPGWKPAQAACHQALRTAVVALVYSADNEERLRNQGVAQALIAVLGLPDTLEGELIADQFRAANRAGYTLPAGNGHDPLADGIEPY